MKVTTFYDMHSGGMPQTEYDIIIVKLPEEEAIIEFTKVYENPYHVTCKCCGSDFAVTEYDSFEEAMEAHKSENPFRHIMEVETNG